MNLPSYPVAGGLAEWYKQRLLDSAFTKDDMQYGGGDCCEHEPQP